jgi:hypothetical protein
LGRSGGSVVTIEEAPNELSVGVIERGQQREETREGLERKKPKKKCEAKM